MRVPHRDVPWKRQGLSSVDEGRCSNQLPHLVGAEPKPTEEPVRREVTHRHVERGALPHVLGTQLMAVPRHFDDERTVQCVEPPNLEDAQAVSFVLGCL
ncbi:hypothetical protein MFU01_19290 [Myxococcus fulvus]|uniref:Uncharacterized protein n=1 Tax=Myxococcus fulvus TaxID=33 RepID=A0A511SZM0_MYXFU|nr:hypothetical protein MFU01_19290 [Myxococcus fulvus]